MNGKVETQLVDFATMTKYEEIPAGVVEFTKSLILKTVAGIICGSEKPSGRKMAELVKRNKGGDVRLIKGDFKTSLWDSVFLNAYLAHASELEDDRYNGAVSWDITVIPLLLSLGEKLRLSGKAFTEAVVVGLEAHTRTCLFGAEHLGLGVIPGAVGPAIGAAKAMGLSRAQTLSAIGIAMSSVPIAYSSFGTDAHFLESSLQALQGMIAADMAKLGMTGNSDLVTFMSNYVGEEKVVPEKVLDQLGKKWVLCEIWIKKYPCCFRMHRQIDMLLKLMKDHDLSYGQIATVEVPISRYDNVLNRPEPKTEGDLQFSLQHVLGAAMLDGDVNMDNINDDATTEPRFRDARDKVRIVTNPALPRRSNSEPAQITVRTRQGEDLTAERMYPIGSPKEPLSKEQVRKLFFKFTRGLLPEKQLQDAADAIANLEKLGSMTELTDILTP